MALSFTTFSASDSPTPVLPDFVSPAAVVVTLFDRLAEALKSPQISKAKPLPRAALTSLAAMAIATIGVSATPPFPPPFASVSIVWLASAIKVRSPAPERMVLSPMVASVRSSA